MVSSCVGDLSPSELNIECQISSTVRAPSIRPMKWKAPSSTRWWRPELASCSRYQLCPRYMWRETRTCGRRLGWTPATRYQRELNRESMRLTDPGPECEAYPVGNAMRADPEP